MRFVVVLAAILAGSAPPAMAQTEGDTSGRPLEFTVRPGGTEVSSAERLERLSRRLEQSEYLFRSICRNCNPAGDRYSTSDPFYPFSALGGGRRADGE